MPPAARMSSAIKDQQPWGAVASKVRYCRAGAGLDRMIKVEGPMQ